MQHDLQILFSLVMVVSYFGFNYSGFWVLLRTLDKSWRRIEGTTVGDFSKGHKIIGMISIIVFGGFLICAILLGEILTKVVNYYIKYYRERGV